jgi:hypothetical protein
VRRAGELPELRHLVLVDVGDGAGRWRTWIGLDWRQEAHDNWGAALFQLGDGDRGGAGVEDDGDRGGAGVEDDVDQGGAGVELRERTRKWCAAAPEERIRKRGFVGSRCTGYIFVSIVTRTCTMYRFKLQN